MAPLVGSGVWFGSTGNARGIFALGFDGSSYTPTTNVYTYSNNGVATGTNLTADLTSGAAASSSPGGF